jgi:peptide/nickel transport system substrate-binding protein
MGRVGHRLLAAAAATTAALSLGFAAPPAEARTPRDTLVMAWNIDAILTMDPAQIGEVVTDEIVTNVCDALIQQDRKDPAKLLPGLAERWEVSEDGLTFTFHLRRGLRHPSGNPVTAEDAVWSIHRVLHLGFGNAAQYTQWGLEKETIAQQVRVLDEHTFQVTVPKPWPPQLFLYVFSGRQGFVLDRKAIEPHVGTRSDGSSDHGNAWLKTNLACIGPYRLARWTASDTVILERQPGWWAGEVPLRRVIIRHVAESAAQRLQLERGDIDLARDLNGEDMAAVDANPNLTLNGALRHQLYYIGANMQHPILGKDDVRMAMRYLVDYEGLGRTVMRYAGKPWNSFAPQGAFGALPPERGLPYRLDLDKAREHLARAGHAEGFTVRLIHGTGFPSSDIAQHFQANAAKVGIRVEIEQMASGQLFSRMRDRNFELAFLAWSPGYPDADANAMRHVFNPDNRAEAKQTMFLSWRAAFDRAWFNDAVQRARLERDEAKRIALYYEIQERFMREGPFMYNFQQIRALAMRKEVRALDHHAFRVFYTSASK